MTNSRLVSGILVLIIGWGSTSQAQDLSGWQDGGAKDAIVSFVHKVTSAESNDFIPMNKRIAAFDMDGTLFEERPQFAMGIYGVPLFSDEVQERALEMYPDFDQRRPISQFFRAYGLMNDGLTVAEYQTQVKKRMDDFHKPFSQMVELIDYLNKHDFEIYIVTGSEQHFARVMAEFIPAIDADNVIGSEFKYKTETNEVGGTKVVIDDSLSFPLNNEGNKVLNFTRRVGTVPTIFIGNSTGDRAMLEWTANQNGPSMSGVVVHDDTKSAELYGENDDEIIALVEEKKWLKISKKDDWNYQ